MFNIPVLSTSSTVMVLKQYLQRHRSAVPANSDLEDGIDNQEQIIPTIPASYFIYYSFRAVDRMRKPLTMILSVSLFRHVLKIFVIVIISLPW